MDSEKKEIEKGVENWKYEGMEKFQNEERTFIFLPGHILFRKPWGSQDCLYRGQIQKLLQFSTGNHTSRFTLGIKNQEKVWFCPLWRNIPFLRPWRYRLKVKKHHIWLYRIHLQSRISLDPIMQEHGNSKILIHVEYNQPIHIPCFAICEDKKLLMVTQNWSKLLSPCSSTHFLHCIGRTVTESLLSWHIANKRFLIISLCWYGSRNKINQDSYCCRVTSCYLEAWGSQDSL